MGDNDQNVVSGSDINWSSSERPVVSGLCAIVGVIAGYVGGLEGLMWYARQPLTPLREIPGWVYHIIRVYGVLPPVVGGWVPATLAAVLGMAAGVGGWRLATRSNVRHIDGPRLNTSIRRAAKAFRPYLGGRGVPIHPKGVYIGEAAECRHMMILGGPGSGKTTVIWPMLNAIVARGDRAIVADFKGDFTKGLPAPFTLLSPADARSARWALGQDIRTRLDAQALAETLIPLGAGEPIWAQGARGLLVGLLAHLQSTKGEGWGFQDIAELAAKVLTNYKLLVSIIIREHPPAKAYLMGQDSKTTQSFLGQLSGALTHVIELGVADYARDEARRSWSVQSWLAGNSKTPPVAVIGWRPSSKELSQAWAASLIEQVVRQLSDLDDCAPNARRVWLVLDEVAQLGKIPSISDALVTLRSKGVRVALGLQSGAQVDETSGPHALTVWSGATDTKILCQLKAEKDQIFASRLLGKRTVERYVHQVTQSGTLSMPSKSGSWHRSEEPVMPEAAFGQKLGPGAGGVKAVILAGSDGASLLQWPFYSVPAYRKPRVVARWVRPDFKRPQWGETPPPVADAPPNNGPSNGGQQNHPGPQIGAGGEALQIAIDANVLVSCTECGEAYRRADADPAAAYKAANAGFSRKLYPSFPDRKALTDAVKSVIDGAPNTCACGAKPSHTQDTQKKAGQVREQGPDRATSAPTKKPQHKSPTQTAQAKSPRKTQPEEGADPFADIVGGVLIDAVAPGASIAADIINAITPDANASDLPMVPGISEPEASAADEIGAGHEPEAGD